MEVFKTVKDFSFYREKLRDSIGLVATMGALHQGHLSLIRRSKSENKFTICSIFVNPIQFNNASDFDKYPNTIEQDLIKLESEGCDAVFVPIVKEIYPQLPKLKFDFGPLEKVMEGTYRPGHFSGVAIVVSKLFHIINPSIAYFGQKDLQQTLVVKQLVEDLSFPLQLQICETLREEDGLAMSSRNIRLGNEERKIAPSIFKALKLIQEKIYSGAKILEAKQAGLNFLAATPVIKIEYLEIAETSSLTIIDDTYTGQIAICIAAYLGDVRLIDNIVFNNY